MCHYSLPGRNVPLNEISIEEFERLAPHILPYVSYLGLSCSDEPLLYCDFFNTIDIVKKYDVPFVYYVTNATLLMEKAIIETINAKVNLVMISIDGATKKTFEDIRRNANFDKVLTNIRILRDKKKEMNSPLPKLRFNCTMMRSNIEEIEDMVRLVKELGGEEIDFRHVIPFGGLDMDKESLFHFKELSNHQFDKARALANELGLEIADCPPNFTLDEQEPVKEIAAKRDIEGRLAEKNLREICKMPWTMTVINPDGNVMPCTYWYTHEPMGNLKRESFEQVWNGEKYQRLRRELLTNELGPNCRHCPAMGYGKIDKKESFEVRNT